MEKRRATLSHGGSNSRIVIDWENISEIGIHLGGTLCFRTESREQTCITQNRVQPTGRRAAVLNRRGSKVRPPRRNRALGAAEKDTQHDGADGGVSTFNAMLSTRRTELIHE